MASTLAQMVKAKYPGVYDDLDDVTLEAKVTAKYPGVYDDIPRSSAATAQAQQPQEPQQSASDAFIGAAVPYLPPQVGRGIVQGVAGSAIGVADLVSKGLRHVPGVNAVVPDQSTFDQARQRFATPENTQQQVGKGLEQAAEFFVPGAGLAKAKAGIATGVKSLDALFGAVLEGASAAGVQTLQHGNTKGAAGTGAATAAFGLGAQAATKGMGWLGERVERALVKPSTADVRDGFQVANIFKYKLGGSLSDTYDKTQKAISDKSAQIKKYINISNQLGRKVNLLDELASVGNDLEQKSARNFGQNASIRGAIDKLLEDPLFNKIAQTGQVDLATANEVKQAVGEMGAWLHDPSGRVIGADNKAMETVANALYDRLKVAIEKQAIGPIRLLNKEISDMIPIRQAIIRRIPVDQRANVLNLGDLIGFSSGSLGLALANRALKSGEVANALVATSKASAPIGATTSRLTGATLSQAKK